MSGSVRVTAGIALNSVLLATFVACLLLIAGPSFAAPGDCNSCHGDNTSTSHHQSELYSQGLCNQCHEGVTTNGDCASCHTFVPQQNAHHATVDATSGNCAECHTNVGDLANCVDCHQGMIRSNHHLAAQDNPRTTTIGDEIDCTVCHTTMAPLTGCSTSGCHTADIPLAHHSTQNAVDGNCSSCHSGLPQVVNCETCHDSNYWTEPDEEGGPLKVDEFGNPLTARSLHHAATGAMVDCTACHTNAPRPADCHDCHSGEAKDRHHVMLQNPPGLSCANCHDAIEVDTKRTDPSLEKAYTGCQVCHAPSEANQQQHHDMAIADSSMTCNTCHSDAGNVPGCATCHDAAYWGVDANNVPLSARDVHHAIPDPSTDCNSCHSQMAFNSSCDSCHASGDANLLEHHDPAQAPVSCGFCHGASADIPATDSCTFCHDSQYWGNTIGGTAMGQHHDVVLGSGSITDCVDCHDTLVPQTCATCHDNAFWTDAGRAGSAEAQHHDVVRPDASLACADCHAGGLPGENNDCQACHDGAAAPFHHESVAVDSNCQECHTALPVVNDCASCHTSNSWVTDARTDHHATATFADSVASGDCSSCHTGQVIGQDCASCHTSWNTDARTDHHNAASANGTSCNTCHESIASASGCLSCHDGNWQTDPITGTTKHHSNTSYGFDCLDCHRYNPDWTFALPVEADCEVCHVDFVNNATVPQIHHATPGYASNDCASCHSGIGGIDPQSLDCATCHASQPVLSGSPAMHHNTTRVDTNVCSNCHTGIAPASLDCAGCHSTQTAVAGLDGSSGMHHGTADGAPDYTAGNCTNCHTNVAAQDCASCHLAEGKTPIPELHHTTDRVDVTDCNQCHTGASVVVNDCEACHSGTTSEQATRHHETPTYAVNNNNNCAVCHEGIEGLSDNALDCATCHADTAKPGDPAMHHGTADGRPDYASGNCGTCHDVLTFDQLMAANKCEDCHTNDNPDILGARHHSTIPAQNENCAACHNVNQAELDCAVCHANQPVLNGQATMHHATATATTGSCTDCHSSVDVTNVTCATCHASQPVFNGGLDMHHNTTLATNGDCMTCHVGADSELMDCAGCHIDPDNPAPISERHHNSTFAQTANCTDCHAAVNTAELDCELCHSRPTQPETLSGSVNMHHNMTISGSTGDCAACHQDATIVGNECSTCHTEGEQEIAATHHNTATYETGLCTSCHLGAEPQGIACATCHGDEGALAEPVGHHLKDEYLNGNCSACHTDIALNGANCESCHNAPGEPSIPETHHAEPLANVGGNCGFCHDAVSTPDVCSNCHSSSPHHTTTWSQMGDCAHCHTVPAAVQDRPAQAACRECHGSNMHDKGGAIQNYGACADCHNTVPFHSKPSRAPGYMVMVGGKGKFNIFWSAMTNGGRDEVEEDVRPNGEDMNDEGGRDRYGAPKINFDWYTIEYGGKNYQVPGFSPPADYSGGDTGGGTSGDLSVCYNCHGDRSDQVSCGNSQWTQHLSNDWVDQATYQLAEATYIGNLCGETPPSGGGGSDVDPNGTYFEAEDYTSFGNNFSERSSSSASGGTYLLAEENSTRSTSGNATSYQLTFSETGTYYIWFLGDSNGSSGDNSLWYGVDGNRTGNANFSTSRGYRWTNDNYNDGPDPTRISISSTGTHTINIWAREDGLRFDGFYLSRSSGSSPSTGDSSNSDDGWSSSWR